MSIVGFHRVLISTAILFCVGFSLWTGSDFLRDRNSLDLALASAFLLAAFGLSYYLIRLNYFLGRETG